MIDVLLVIFGLGMLLVGGELIVRGASKLAKAFNVSKLVLGLTVVAFGTSVPELAVNLAAAISGRGELCFGNVIGSNIANIGLILGIAALLAPLSVQKPVVTREIPIMLLSVLSVAVLGLDEWLDGTPNNYSRSDAFVLLLIFGVFLYSTAYHVFNSQGHGADELVSRKSLFSERPPQLWKYVGITLVGLVLLAIGGEVTVRGATGLAQLAGISQVVIGLTVVSIGTSLPELVTSITATRRGEVDLAVGNVVGSNIFNLLLVLGASNAISPTTLPAGGYTDLLLLVVLSIILLPMSITGWRLDRKEGAVLLFSYVVYVTWRVWSAFD